MGKPSLPHIGVLAFVPDTWNPRWQSRHHVLSRLSAYFHVLWVEPPTGWRHSIRALGRPKTVDPKPPSGLRVYRPEPWLPRFYRWAWLADLTRDLRLHRARRRLESMGCSKIVLHIWRPDFLFALGDADADLTVYHVDDEYSFSDVATPSENEIVLLENADQVIVHSAGLMETKGRINPRTALVPNGVDFAEYATAGPQPSDLAQIPAPRIGYAGYLQQQLAWKLIGTLVRRHPEWSFVFAGASYVQPGLDGIVGDLSSHPNLHFLGPKTARELARYPQHFDCGIMPYRESDYTNCIYPMKLHGYLASGRPAVGTPIRTLKDFSHVVDLARTPDEWSAALTRALSPAANTYEKRRERQTVARMHDWNALALRVAKIIANGLGETLERPQSTSARDHFPGMAGPKSAGRSFPGVGLRAWDDVLATPERLAARRHLESDALHAPELTRARRRHAIHRFVGADGVVI